jgi:hypothetical protein
MSHETNYCTVRKYGGVGTVEEAYTNDEAHSPCLTCHNPIRVTTHVTKDSYKEVGGKTTILTTTRIVTYPCSNCPEGVQETHQDLH